MILGPLFFLAYINDLTADLKCSVKLFADDTSLFTVVRDPIAAANDMNHDLELIGQWAHDWKMSFNPDPQKQAVELLLSKKRTGIDHPVVLFNDIPVKKVEEHVSFWIRSFPSQLILKQLSQKREKVLVC